MLFMWAYLTHWYKVGPPRPHPWHTVHYISAARAIAHMGGPMLLHRLASALQVKDPHRLPPSNVPELH